MYLRVYLCKERRKVKENEITYLTAYLALVPIVKSCTVKHSGYILHHNLLTTGTPLRKNIHTALPQHAVIKKFKQLCYVLHPVSNKAQQGRQTWDYKRNTSQRVIKKHKIFNFH